MFGANWIRGAFFFVSKRIDVVCANARCLITVPVVRSCTHGIRWGWNSTRTLHLVAVCIWSRRCFRVLVVVSACKTELRSFIWFVYVIAADTRRVVWLYLFKLFTNWTFRCRVRFSCLTWSIIGVRSWCYILITHCITLPHSVGRRFWLISHIVNIICPYSWIIIFHRIIMLLSHCICRTITTW